MNMILTHTRTTVALVVGLLIVLTTFIGDHTKDTLFVFLLFYVLLMTNKFLILKENLWFLVLLVQYPVWNIVRLALTTDINMPIISSSAHYDMWGYSMIIRDHC